MLSNIYIVFLYIQIQELDKSLAMDDDIILFLYLHVLQLTINWSQLMLFFLVIFPLLERTN
jgi:hypothetical protein